MKPLLVVLLALASFSANSQLIPEFQQPKQSTSSLEKRLSILNNQLYNRKLREMNSNYRLTPQQRNKLAQDLDFQLANASVNQQTEIKRQEIKDSIDVANGNSPSYSTAYKRLVNLAYPSPKYAPIIRYDFPKTNDPNAVHYKIALKEISMMLRDSIPLNLGKAIYLVENAYYNNELATYDDFKNAIRLRSDFCKKRLNGNNDDTAKKWVLHKFMSDSIGVHEPEKERIAYSQPYEYDFDDFMGKEDWSKMFVTKLLAKHSGQCHSMPLLYLLLAEELGIEAHLAFSPQHSYIMLQDENKKWYNLELTSGQYLSNSAIMESGYVKTEAVENGIYMRPLSKKETIAQCLVDLSHGYIAKFGYDSNVKDMLYEVMRADPTSITANLTMSNYQTELLKYVAHQMGNPPKEVLKRSLKANEILTKRNIYYNKVDDLGYVPMPKKLYENWIESVRKEKGKREKTITPVNLK
ncbi:MAG: hypothetical protein ACJAWV_001811 [Flammeovirgaceae bacterium]|jgi:hypothetical protein